MREILLYRQFLRAQDKRILLRGRQEFAVMFFDREP